MFQIRPYSKQQLDAFTTPAAIPGGNMEAYPKVLYDTQTYVAAGSATLLTFFTTTNADLTLSNMEGPGQLPDPKYFNIWQIRCHIILPESDAAAPTAWGNLQSIVDTRRPRFRLTIQDKPYGDIPLIDMPHGGGLHGFGYSDGTGAGVVSHEYAHNGAMTGGFWVGGALWLKPKVNFSATINWGGATVAVAADTLIRIELHGVEYRAIV